MVVMSQSPKSAKIGPAWFRHNRSCARGETIGKSVGKLSPTEWGRLVGHPLLITQRAFQRLRHRVERGWGAGPEGKGQGSLMQEHASAVQDRALRCPCMPQKRGKFRAVE